MCFYIKYSDFGEDEVLVGFKLVYLNKCFIFVLVKILLLENVVWLGIDCEKCL